MFRVAIVGCGGIAAVHAHALGSHDNITITAFTDIKKERAENFAAQYGGEAFETIDEMLSATNLDAVHICTPHYLHFPMIQKCLEKDLYVFCEKPPVMTQSELDMLNSFPNKCRVGFSFQNRWNSNFIAAKSIIEKGDFGAVTGAKGILTWHRDIPYYKDSGWRGSHATEGGGVVINQGIHTLDLIVQLLGIPISISATTANHHLDGIIEVEDMAEAYLDYGNKSAIFYATTAYCTDSPVIIEITCERGTLRLFDDILEIKTESAIESRNYKNEAAVGKAYWGTSHSRCISDFYKSIENGTAFSCNTDSITPTMRLMFALYSSAANGGRLAQL